MAVWKDKGHKDVPTADWFGSLLEKSGFKPERLWIRDTTHFARAGGFVFQLGREHIEATGRVASGVRVALMKRNARTLTDLYEDGLTVVFKAPEALRAFHELLSHSEALTQALRHRMAIAHARGEEEMRRGQPLSDNEELYLVPAVSMA